MLAEMSQDHQRLKDPSWMRYNFLAIDSSKVLTKVVDRIAIPRAKQLAWVKIFVHIHIDFNHIPQI